MSPEKRKTFSPAERRRIVAEVVRRQEAEGITNGEMGLALGYRGGAVWSQVRNEKYAGDVDRCIARAAQWLRDRSHRADAPAVTYVETSIGRQIMAVCSRAWALPTIGLVVTPSGAGKTAALAEFARRRGERALWLQVGEDLTTRKALLEELCLRLGVALSPSASSDDRARGLKKHFANSYLGGKGSPFCLLLDEATRIRASAANLLRGFHDDPACRVALVFAGTEELDALMHNRAWIPGGTAQLRSRVAAAYQMRLTREISMADVQAVGRSILKSMGIRRDLAAAAWKYLRKIAQADGRLRNVAKRLYAVRDTAESAGARPAFSARELDFVATLVNQPCEFVHRESPFPKGPASSSAAVGEPAEARRRKAS